MKELVMHEGSEEFCTVNKLSSSVRIAVEIIHECYPNILALHCRLSMDPAGGNEWLVIEIEVLNSLHELQGSPLILTRITRRWLDMIPQGSRARGLIRFDVTPVVEFSEFSGSENSKLETRPKGPYQCELHESTCQVGAKGSAWYGYCPICEIKRLESEVALLKKQIETCEDLQDTSPPEPVDWIMTL